MTHKNLIEISSSAIAPDRADVSEIPDPLRSLIGSRNGFYAFESALFVRPWGGGAGSAEWWNAPEGWRAPYGELVDGFTFFAEDVFGFQFAAGEKGFYSFDPETAELQFMATTVNEWADQILQDHEELTGSGLAHAWQSSNGPLRSGYRLAAAIPFCLGGEFALDALKPKRELELARFRADIYAQIRDLPDGAQVRINLI
ncbi:hypothetical protein ACIPPM_15770 [Streptomyces sp. NPDC090119]|uniref:hypothetical protein n=1 Tax=Streptomyces sp. NPDC090119 TaxID=3365951 RepID=UPI003821922A